MKLKLFRHLWGVDQSWELAFPKFRQAGFVGIEAPMPGESDEKRFRQLLAEHDFEYIPMLFTGGGSAAEHVESFRRQLDRAAGFTPPSITCHSGRDAWSVADAEQFFRRAVEIEKEVGVPVGHETHRGRVMFNPWVTRDLLARFPDLKLCCDFSHWVCVCERLIDDEIETIRLCAERCIHLHARVGYDEGPQVPDPRAPEYKNALEAHERWWDVIWDAQNAAGHQASSLTPEFGPPGYLHTLPYTNVPVANLWDVCHWQAKRQAERFAARFS